MTVHDQLRSLLLSVRRRWRAEVVLRAVGRGAACAALPVLLGAGIAAWLAPGDAALMVLSFTVCLAALAAVVVAAWRLGHTPGDRQLARFVEERAALRRDVVPFDDVVVSAVDALPPLESEPFRSLVVEAAVRRLRTIGADGIVTTRALRRAGAEAVAGGAALAVASALAWPMLARATEAAWITVFPQSIQVEVLPGDTRVPAGQPLTIRASVRARRQAAHALHAAVDRRGGQGSAHRRDDARRRRVSLLVRLDRSIVSIPGDRGLAALERLHRHRAGAVPGWRASICATSIRRSPTSRPGKSVMPVTSTRPRARGCACASTPISRSLPGR